MMGATEPKTIRLPRSGRGGRRHNSAQLFNKIYILKPKGLTYFCPKWLLKEHERTGFFQAYNLKTCEIDRALLVGKT